MSMQPRGRPICLIALAIYTLAGPLAWASELVAVGEVRSPRSNPSLTVVGYLQSKHSLTLAMRMDGTLNYTARVGTTVNKGQLVAALEDTMLRLAIAEQELVVQRESLLLGHLEREVERVKALARAQNLSQILLAEKENERAQTNANWQIAILRVEQLMEKQRRSQLMAPVDGIISKQWRQAGEEIRQGEPVLSMEDVDHLEIVASIPFRYRAQIATGLAVTASADDFNANAVVRDVIPVGDAQIQQFQVRMDVTPDVINHWAIGHLLSLQIPLSPPGELMEVPRAAVLITSDRQYVLVVNGDNIVHEVGVSMGPGSGDWVSVSGDLVSGERIVTRGGEVLEAGDSVRVHNR